MAYPNLVLIGPAKSGTTSVFNWLSEHPEVCVSSVKETHHFYVADEDLNGTKEFEAEAFEKYQTYFKHCPKESKCIVEATPVYLYSESAIKAFCQLDKNNTKFLFIYRDPADRIFSEYRFHRYKTKRFKAGGFREYIGYKPPNLFPGRKVKLGYYYQYLQKWVDAFGDRVLLMHFEDLKSDPLNFMKELAGQANIDPGFFDTYHFNAKNKTMKLKSRSIHMFLLKVMRFIPKAIVDTLSPIYYKINGGKIPPVTPEERQLKEKIRQHYSVINQENANFRYIRIIAE